MEHNDTTGNSHDVGNLSDIVPEEWCILDEWSDHSESELEEGEIVDSDTDGDTKGDTVDIVSVSQVPGGHSVNSAPWAAVEQICKTTTRNLLKMAETTFSGSEDGEIVEIESQLSLNKLMSHRDVTGRNIAGHTGVDSVKGGTTDTSSGFCIVSKQKQLQARFGSESGCLSSNEKLDGQKVFPNNQMEAMVERNEVGLASGASEGVRGAQTAARDEVLVESSSSKRPDVQTAVSLCNKAAVCEGGDASEEGCVQNGSVALSSTIHKEELVTRDGSPDQLGETEFSSLDTETVAADDVVTVDETTNHADVPLGNECVSGRNGSEVIKDNEQLLVTSTDLVASEDKDCVYEEIVPVSSNMRFGHCTSQNVVLEMESLMTHVGNIDSEAEEPLEANKEVASAQNEDSVSCSDNPTRQQDVRNQCSNMFSTSDTEFAVSANEKMDGDKTVATDAVESPESEWHECVGNDSLSEINEHLISAIEHLSDGCKVTSETASREEEYSVEGLPSDPDKAVVMPSVRTPSSAVMESTVTSPAKLDVASSAVTPVVSRTPDVVEVLVLPSKETGEVTDPRKETGSSAVNIDEVIDITTAGTERISSRVPGRQDNTHRKVTAKRLDTGTEANFSNELSVPPHDTLQSQMTVKIPADSPKSAMGPAKTSSGSSSAAPGSGPELLRRLQHSNSEIARIGVGTTLSRLQCDFCPMVCESESQLILHLNSHEKVCCATKVASTFEYSHHMYQCVACNFSTRSRMAFREHIRSHIVKFPYSCGRCRIVCESVDHLQSHSAMIHPGSPCLLVPHHCSTLQQILHKLGPAAPSTITRLHNMEGTPISTPVLPPDGVPGAVVARPESENKEQQPDTEQVIVLDDGDEEAENQNDDSHSPCHLKISSVVSLSGSAKTIENFSSKDDTQQVMGKDSLLVHGSSENLTRPSKPAVVLECFYANGLYQCKHCRYETPSERHFHSHVVRDVHEKANVCVDCRSLSLSTLLSESHHCPMVEKVMKAMRSAVQSSGDNSASGAEKGQPGPGISTEGGILHISNSGDASVQRGNLGASGVRQRGSSPAQASATRITPVTSATPLYFSKQSGRTSVVGEAANAAGPEAVHSTPSLHDVTARGSVQDDCPVTRPLAVVITPTPEVISPIVIQPINTGQLAGYCSPATTVGGADRGTYSTVHDGETLHLSRTASPVSHWNTVTTAGSLMTGLSGELRPRDSNLSGCTGHWSTQSSVGSFSGVAAGFTSSDTSAGLDSSFTEAFSMLEELGNAQAGLCALPQPQLSASGDVTSEDPVRVLASGDISGADRQNEVIIVPDTPTELTSEGDGGDLMPRLIEDPTMQAQVKRIDVVPNARSSPRLDGSQHVGHLHKSTPERPAEAEKSDDDRFAYYRCGFSSCSFLGDSETGFCNHYYDCHRDVYIYRCAFCSLMFRYPPQLCEHLRHFHHQVRYRCLSCREPFQTQRQLIVHMIQSHRLNTSFRCAASTGCTVSTNSLSQFRAHYELHHTAESSFACSCCSMEFSAVASLLHHTEKSINRFVSCPVCKRMSTAAACKKLLHHIITEHPNAPRTIVKMNFINCWEKLTLGRTAGSVASATSTQLFMPNVLTKSKANATTGEGAEGSREGSPLMQHLREVMSAPVKTAKVKQTARKTQAVAHSVLRNELMCTEEPEIMLTCDRCNFACTIPVLLDQHQRLHDRTVAVPKGTLFKCSWCPFFTNSVNEFKTHTRYHLGPQTVLRYFRCTVCGRFATNDMNLIEEHMEKKHPESSCSYKVSREVLTHPNTTVTCQHCGVTCLGEASLAKHMQQRHSSLAEPPKEKPSKRSSMIGRPPRESSVVSIEKYHCDFCEFDTNSAALMKQHHANEHMGKTAETAGTPVAVVVKQEPVESRPPAEIEVTPVATPNSVAVQVSRTSPALLTCEYCPYNTHVHHHMERHRKSHDEQMQITEGFRCGYCRYVSTQKYTMTRHVRRYHASEPMNLKLVSGGVVSALPTTELMTNDEQSSGTEMTNAVVVGTVKQMVVAAEQTGGDSSVLSISDDEDASLNCTLCSYRANSRSHYIRHRHNHTNTYKDGYRCDYCGYTSATKGPVTKHVTMQHSGLLLKISHISNAKKLRRGNDANILNTRKQSDQVASGPEVQETSKEPSTVHEDGGATNSESTTGVMAEPGSIMAFQQSLPKEMIFKMSVECPLCDYSTKVNYNMVRHLQGHRKTADKAKSEQVKATDRAGPVATCNNGLTRSVSSEVVLAEAEEENGKPSESEKPQMDTTPCVDTSSSDEDDSDYVMEEGEKGARDSTQYCSRVENMDLYRCTKCVFMHRFPSKVLRHYFYKHAKCYPYKCGHCTFEAVESGKIKRHCVLMHDLLPIKVIKRQVDDSVTPTLSEGVVMSDMHRENVDVITADGNNLGDDTDTWLGAYITKTNSDNRQQCRICGYVQLGASSVKRHVLAVHLKFYPYSCRYCSYSQVEINKVKKHIEHSHPGRPCSVVKRKLGVPPGEGDDNNTQNDDVVALSGHVITQSGDVTRRTGDVSQQDDRDASTRKASGRSRSQEDRAPGTEGSLGRGWGEGCVTEGEDSTEPTSGEVTEQPSDSDTEEQAATQAFLGAVTTSGQDEQTARRDAEADKSTVMDVDRLSPNKHTQDTEDEDSEEAVIMVAGKRFRRRADSEALIGSKNSEQTVAERGNETIEINAVSVAGQTSIGDHSKCDTAGQSIIPQTCDQNTGGLLEERFIQGDIDDLSDKPDSSETRCQAVATAHDSSRNTAESSVEIVDSERKESSKVTIGEGTTDLTNEAEMANTETAADVSDYGETDQRSNETGLDGMMHPDVTSSDSVGLSTKGQSQVSDENDVRSLDEGERNDTRYGNMKENISVGQNATVSTEQHEYADILSDDDADDDADNDGGRVDAQDEPEDVNGVNTDADKNQEEETSNVLSRTSVPALPEGSFQVGQVVRPSISLGTVTAGLAGSSLHHMRSIKKEVLDTTGSHMRNREEPILTVFANELAETAIKQEEEPSTEVDVTHLKIPQEAERTAWPTNAPPVEYKPLLLRQRKVFLCVYCDYRSMYSPSDVRKHIFAVHMRRYPYRCSYCAFQNMKKFNVQKHTKKAHAGKLVVVNEAPVFRNNITVLESLGNKVNVGVVGADGIPVLDVNLLAALLHQLDDSPTKDIPGKKWTRKVSVPPPVLHDASSVPSSETEKDPTTGGAAVLRWRCVECGMEAEKINRVQVHVLTRHLKLRPYQCPYCPWGTWKTTPVEEHIRQKHPSETPSVLENIGRKLAEIKKYITKIPQSEAPVPPSSAVSPAQLRGDLPTMHCDLCPYTASSQSRLHKHRKTHFCYRPFGCFHCEYTSFSRFKVRCHSSRVHKDKQVIVKTLKTPDMTDPRNSKVPQSSPYKSVGAGVQVCGHCPYMGSTSEKLDSHMKREHPELMSYKCGHCGIYLTSKEHMAEHVIEQHAVSSRTAEQSKTGEPPRKPDAGKSEVVVKFEAESAKLSNKRPNDNSTGGAPTIPSKKLKLSDLLSTPKSAGLEPKSSSSPLSAGYLFRCKHCNFTSTLSLVMRHHAMAHLHYRPFCCPLCDTVRAVKSYPIKKHIAVYHQGGSVQCALERDAEMEYKVQASYTRETLSGTVMAHCEKMSAALPDNKEALFVFKCNLCSYTSPTQKFMQHHVMAHLNYRPYSCPYCATMRSVRSYPVKKHIRSMHHGKKVEVAYSADPALDMKLAASFRKQRLDNSKDTAQLMTTTSPQKKILTLPVAPACQKKVPTVSLVAVPQDKTSMQGPEKKWQTVTNKASQSSSSDRQDVGGGHQGSDKRPKMPAHTTYVCKWCGYTAATPSLVRLHAMVHFGYRPFSCPHCTTMKSVRSYPIKKHIRTMHPGKPIEVILKTNPDIEAKVQQSYLPQELASKASATSKDDGKKAPVEWRMSDKVTTTTMTTTTTKPERLLLKKSKKGGKFVCNTCSYASPKWTLMRRHVMVHFSYRPYHCPYCQTMRSVRGSPVRMHIRSMHPGKPTNVLFRPDHAADAKVLSGFSRQPKVVPKPTAKKPSKSMAPVEDKVGDTVASGVTAPDPTVSPKRMYSVTFCCINCPFKTKYKADLRFHLMGEMGYRPFKCFYCDHKAVGRCLLRKHQRKHHASSKFAVSMDRDINCEMSLVDLMERSVNNGIPTRPRPNNSSEPLPVVVKLEPKDAADVALMSSPCGATGDMRVFKRKRYNCTECSYSCSKKKLLLKHCFAHHDPKKYGCEYCDYKEFYPSHIRRHCRRQHRGLVPSCILLSSGEQVSFKSGSADVTREVPLTTSTSGGAIVAPTVKTKKEAASNDKSAVTDSVAPDNVSELFNPTLGKYECYLCLYSNSNMTLFKKHISVHYPARWQCGHCALKFRQMDRLRRHSRLAHPGIPIRCANDEPGYTATVKTDPSPQAKPLFVSKIKVTARKSIHKIIPVVDDIKAEAALKKKVTARKSISRFVSTHSESDLRFFCGLCPFAATNEEVLSKHMMVVHSSGNAVQLKCGFCSFTTFDDITFIEHARSHTLGSTSVNSKKQPQIDPSAKEMQPELKLVDLLYLSQSELETLLVKNEISGIYI